MEKGMVFIMDKKTGKFPIGSYVIVTNKKLQSYGLIGQVINPKDFNGYCGKKSICVLFKQWLDGSEKILKIAKMNVVKIEEDKVDIIPKKIFVGNYNVATCNSDEFLASVNLRFSQKIILKSEIWFW